eukprot:m.25702 g.25702  ORF g.25702 m.25702 type:complete len:330 (-) comp11623_c0_seq1:132-1121(-)
MTSHPCLSGASTMKSLQHFLRRFEAFDESCRDLMSTCVQILLRHRATVITFATGMRKLHTQGSLAGREEYLTGYLDRFLMGRIGIRFVFNQHLSLFSEKHRMQDPSATGDNKIELGSRWVGSIDADVNVANIAEDAASNASLMCNELYGVSPDFKIILPTKQTAGPFTYVPSHLYHILFELLKNSFRATAEYHEHSESLPDIRLVIVKGAQDLTIKISDEGGGIAHEDRSKLFSYFYSTASQPLSLNDEDFTDIDRAPMAGFGYGLPVARLYSRYFGGDLNLMTIQGYGTDCFIHLKSVAEDATETLPSFNVHEINKYKHGHKDWIRHQ